MDREQLKQEIVRVRAEIQAAIDSAAPQGWWERIVGVDDERIDQVAEKVKALQEELSVYQEAWKELADAAASDVPPAPAPPSPSGVPAQVSSSPRAPEREEGAGPAALASVPAEVQALAVKIRDARELIQQLRALSRTVREVESVARVVHGGRSLPGTPMALRGYGETLQAAASFARQRQTRDALSGTWDRDAAEANLLAHRLGIELELPRRRLTSAELAVGATGGVVVDSADLSDHILGAGEALDRAAQEARELIAAITAEEPAAAAVPAHLLPERVEVELGADGMPMETFVAHWRDLLKVHTVLERLRAEGASRADLLGPLIQWQQRAQALRAACGDLTPIPPVNEGIELRAFVASLTARRPAWEAELDAFEARKKAEEEAMLRRPEVVAAARERFQASWGELLRLGGEVGTARAAGGKVFELARAVKAWDEEAKRAEELAQRYGFEPVPLRFDGMDLRRFAEELTRRMPGWRRVVGAW